MQWQRFLKPLWNLPKQHVTRPYKFDSVKNNLNNKLIFSLVERLLIF